MGLLIHVVVLAQHVQLRAMHGSDARRRAQSGAPFRFKQIHKLPGLLMSKLSAPLLPRRTIKDWKQLLREKNVIRVLETNQHTSRLWLFLYLIHPG